MDCPHCARTNPEDARFCNSCGQALAAGCPACGAENPPDSRFCNQCGAGLGEVAAGLQREPSQYTPRHLADKILQSKSALEGERKQVTVLFADVKGSLELAEQLDAEVWHQILDRFFEILSEGVHRFEGTVNQYTGDGIMALFGAPIAHEDHAHRACYAALHLRDELREHTREIKRRHGLEFGVRIGLNSGEVVVGKIGDDLRMDYTAQGHTVGLAQRMEALASGGSIYVSAATSGLVKGYFEFEDLGDFDVKGAAEPVHVFELTGTGSVRTRFDLSRARGLSRFVGRSDEMTLLEAALEQGLAGSGRTIGVVAQAGTGKSRLCYEFIERCRARGLKVYEARGLAHGKQLPLLPMVELMRDFFGIDERDSDRVVREKIAGRSLLLDESLRDELPIFFDLLGVPDPERPMPNIDPEALQRRMHAAVRAVSAADGRVEPGVLLIEDLHWLDPASDAMLEHILEGGAGTRGLVIVNFRPEYRAHWMQHSHYQQISLLPLSPEALRELLGDLLGGDASVRELPDTIYARTGGNPFFIEEVVQSLVDERHLEGQRGAYKLASPVAKLPIPDSVQAVLAARIDRLPEREKHVLQAASVIGKTFREPVLSRVVDLDPESLADALRNLQTGEFLYEAALYPEREYTFKHPLTQEVADHSQLTERRVRAHAAVARAIEELEAEHLDEQAALLAHHWEGAEEPGRAAHWHERAAHRIGVTDYSEAQTHWQRVDALLADVASSEDVDRMRLEALAAQIRLGFRTGLRVPEAEQLFARGRAMSEDQGDDAGQADLIVAYAAVVQSHGRLREYFAYMCEAEEIAKRTGDESIWLTVGLDLVWGHIVQGYLRRAAEIGLEVSRLTKGDRSLGVDHHGYSYLVTNIGFSGYSLILMGRLEEGTARMDESRRLFADDEIPETLCWHWGMRIEQEVIKGNPDSALVAARNCAESAERSGSRFDTVSSRAWSISAYVLAGRFQEAADLFESARALAGESVGADILITNRWAVPLAYLALGDLGHARALADEGIELCARETVRAFQARSHVSRAAVARAQGDTETARADLAEAERLIEETEAYAFTPMVREERARLDEDSDGLREAQQGYAEIGADGHAKRLAEELDA